MKKFLSALLVVLMLASISTLAFAAPSPTQDKDKADATIVEAEKDEAKAAKAVKESAAKDEDGEEAVAAIGALPADANDEMKADFEDLADALVDAKDALAAGDAAAIPADIKADAAEGATVSASQPFRAVASSYPATITIAVDNPDDFVGMMVFMNGKWVKLNTVVNDDGTVTFVLDQPAVLSIASQVVSAA